MDATGRLQLALAPYVGGRLRHEQLESALAGFDRSCRFFLASLLLDVRVFAFLPSLA
jgi:hypothetical protein